MICTIKVVRVLAGEQQLSVLGLHLGFLRGDFPFFFGFCPRRSGTMWKILFSLTPLFFYLFPVASPQCLRTGWGFFFIFKRKSTAGDPPTRLLELSERVSCRPRAAVAPLVYVFFFTPLD